MNNGKDADFSPNKLKIPPRHKYGFAKYERFPDYKVFANSLTCQILAKRTGQQIGPGTYNDGAQSNKMKIKPCSIKYVTFSHLIKLENASF